jgi:uncharacterized protein (DUF1015 family)
MARVMPFRAWRYDTERVADLADVLAPPYDVISPEQQALLYEREPHNIIRVELAKAEPAEGEERYSHAAELLQRWIESGYLLRDEDPAFYFHRHFFTVDDRVRARTGVFAAVGLEDYRNKIVLPHEATLSKPKADRLSLLRATRMNISPIFGIVPDADAGMRAVLCNMHQGELVAVASGPERHELWRVTGEKARQLTELLASRQIVIADGHHRYETSLSYRDEVRQRLGAVPTDVGSEYTLMYLCSSVDRGLRILAAHRLLKLDSTPTEAELWELAGKRFEVTQHPRLADGHTCLDLLGESEIGFACYLAGNWYLLTLREPLPPGKLHVEALHEMLIDPLLGGSEQRENRLGFIVSHAEAIDRIDSGEFQVGFFLKPVRIEELEARSRSGGVMPQKSTYFYPKVPTGLVLKSAEAGESL